MMCFKTPSRLACCVVLSAALSNLCGSPAIAGGESFTSASSTNLELKIAGKISPKCDVRLAEEDVELDFSSRDGHQDFLVEVDCNQELGIEMRSQHGGFRLETIGKNMPKARGFTGFVPYAAEFSVNALGAQPVLVNSELMKNSASGGSIGVIPYKTNGNLSLKWSAKADLFGGRYSDVIEIRASGNGM